MGSFLFWKVDRENTRRFRFYDFVRTYHQRDAPHCPPHDLVGDRDVIAVLDGQQRLTALNIGLRGTYAAKEPRKWWNNPDAFPNKKLHLNLAAQAADNEEGLVFDFRFLQTDRPLPTSERELWFPVADIIDMKPGPPMLKYLVDQGRGSDVPAFERLQALHDAIHKEPVITYFLEQEQDLERVLEIFIRVNSGGTKLSYSDLLLSTATAHWKNLDAREAIFQLVDSLNETGNRFDLSKDFVLKAGLMLCDIASVGFKVVNFDADNMAILESRWREVEAALRLTVRLVADFGFNWQSLSADSALLPIAYYVRHRKLEDSYRTSSRYTEDREAIRRWLVRSLLKQGIWGSGLDSTLTALRAAIKEHGGDGFPVAQIETEMTKRGRSLRFEEDELKELAELRFEDRRLFPLLSLLYPHVDLRNQFHVDHVFPRARFRKRELRAAGVPEDQIDHYLERVDALANFQLLDGILNTEKNDSMPAKWIAKAYVKADARSAYLERHDLGDVPEELTGFGEFYEARRGRILERMRKLLG
jgi:hypothetical protein